MLASLALREPARRHAEVLIDAAGLAIASIGVLGLMYDGRAPAGVLRGRPARRRASAWPRSARSTARPARRTSASLNLLLFIAAAGAGDTLYVVAAGAVAGGVGMLAAGLRPRRPLPPEPDPYRMGDAPLAARADDEDVVVRVRDDDYGSRRARRSQSTWFCLRMIRCSIRCSSASERGSWPE